MRLSHINCLNDKPIGQEKRIEQFISDKPQNKSGRNTIYDSQETSKILVKTRILNDKK